jgi:hypothetical protein
MSKVPGLKASQPTKPCKVCAEPIKQAARICNQCKSYQDWRANINVSSTVLSLLVALVTVLTAAVPAIKSALTPEDSQLSFVFQDASFDSIGILVSNSGIRPGAVGGGQFLLTGDPLIWSFIELSIVGRPNGSSFIIDPGTSKLLELSSGVTDLGPEDPMIGDCLLQFQKKEFAAKSREKMELRIPCDDMRRFIVNAHTKMQDWQKRKQAPSVPQPPAEASPHAAKPQ